MRTHKELQEFVKLLCADEANILMNLLPTVMKSKKSNQKIIKRERKSVSCPNCKSHFITKNGTKDGRQRYICKDCHKSFSDNNDSIVYKSKHTYEQWIQFINCELHDYILKDEACEVNINITTAFSWRHKLYEAIAEVKKSITLSNIIQIDGTFVPINLKGTKPKNMPRISKKRSSSAYRGISHHKVCIMSAVDDNDHMFFEVVGLGSETNKMLESVEYKIKNCDVLISDGKYAFQTLCHKLGCVNEVIKSGHFVNEHGYNLSTINGLHSELKINLKRRRGVSIKHLQGYLDMFLFKKMLNYTVENQDKDIVAYNKSVPSRTKQYIKDIFEKALPISLYEAYHEYNYGIYKK
ncbi:MAG: IS1595 family transposase [Bacilli bacterium]|nr:IS1595 family transposase [Bacilli bacterium]